MDEGTLEKYRTDGRSDILRHVSEGDEGAEIVLSPDGRCPFLDECGLCGIISELGDSYTSEICREHPRFYHRICDRAEVGLGAVCEEAARLILTEENFLDFVRVGEYEKCAADETDFDTLAFRGEIFATLSNEGLSYREKLSALSEKYGVSDRLSESFEDAFSALEYLDEENLPLFEAGLREQRPEVQKYALRFLAYLVFRHVSVATDEDNLKARVGFCLLLVRMLENATAKAENIKDEDVFDTVRRISSEIEYSEDNTASLIFEFECSI